MKPGASLAIVETPTLGGGYAAIQGVHEPLEVFELIPSGPGAVVLVSGPGAELAKWIAMFPRENSRLVLPSEQVIQSYLGLENPPLGQIFGCFESQRIGDVFEAAFRLEQAGWLPFDLRIQRGATLRASVFATGAGDVKEPRLQDLHGAWTSIKDPSTSLRDFFELRPQV